MSTLCKLLRRSQNCHKILTSSFLKKNKSETSRQLYAYKQSLVPIRNHFSTLVGDVKMIDFTQNTNDDTNKMQNVSLDSTISEQQMNLVMNFIGSYNKLDNIITWNVEMNNGDQTALSILIGLSYAMITTPMWVFLN